VQKNKTKTEKKRLISGKNKRQQKAVKHSTNPAVFTKGRVCVESVREC
jgi:hypothetical protein